jgi:hypothetical protein
MDKTVAIVEFLEDWQNMSYEEVETASDIKVFNVIGTIIQLVKNGYMPMSATYSFISDILSLTKEEEERIAGVVTNAYESIIEIH